MAFLSKSEKTVEEEKIRELMGKPIKKEITDLMTRKGANSLKTLLKIMAQEGSSSQEIEDFFNYTMSKTRYIDAKKKEYFVEAELADTVYKAYVNDGISRIEKINGRFLASQTVKLDMLIEQNNRIIQLLEKLAEK